MDVSSWLVDTVYVAQQTGASDHGDPTYGAPAAVKARVTQGRDRKAQEIDHTHVLWMQTAVRVDDRLWLDGDDSTNADLARIAVHVSVTHDKSGGSTLYKVLL